MKTKLPFLFLFAFCGAVFAQEYPEVSIRDIQFVEPDSLNYYGPQGLEPPQPLQGDTVTITGVVMFPPFMGADPDSTETISVAAPGIILQDTEEAEWGGVIVRDLTSSPDFAILESGLVIKATGIVSSYFTTTQFNLIKFDASDIINVMNVPEPVSLTLDSFYVDTPSEPNFLAEKWENVIVEFRNVTVVESEVMGPGTFSFMDENGYIMNTYDRSNTYRSGYTAPLPGTTINRIQGFIETWTSGTTWFMLNPVNLDDIEFGTVSPPVINNVQRDKNYARFGESVVITADVNDADGSSAVAEVKLFYRLSSDSVYTEMDMTLVNAETGTYNATIPAQNELMIVEYYISSKDMANTSSYSPSAAADDPYFYFVLDRELRIQEVQYVPDWSSHNSFDNMEVTVTGVVTADTSDITGGVFYSPTVYIQNGSGQWSGIIIFGTEAQKLNRGDSVSVTGIVNEFSQSNGTYTRIGTIEQGVQVTVLESGVDIPEATIISTDIIATPDQCLSYECVLVKVENITVTDENEDGEPGPDGANYGEAVIADDSGIGINLLLDYGKHDYHNFWDASQADQPIRITTGDTFESITGFMFYSYSSYKIVPRINDDFVGHVVVGVDEINKIVPDNYALLQNYPNPFNPTTKIQFNLPEAGHVKLKVFNILGQQITSLVDGIRDAGAHIVDFDASSLTSGIYFYEMSVNNFRTLNKMILIK